jgi:hypothetical protein
MSNAQQYLNNLYTTTPIVQYDSEFIDLFFWISHGANITQENNYYLIQNPFKFINFYSKPYQLTSTNEVDAYVNNLCLLLLGSQPVIPIPTSFLAEKYKSMGPSSFVPPLVFSISTQDSTTLVYDYAGLYYVKIAVAQETTSGETQCISIQNGVEKLLGFDELFKMGTKKQEFSHEISFFSYSTIFKTVKEACLVKNIKPENAVLSIFSCQARERKITGTKDLYFKINKENHESATILNEHDIKNKNYQISPTIIGFKTLKGNNWETLANLKTQGCGLNVLSYYNIIEEHYAREKTSCLSLFGTSIHTIVDYVYNYLKNNNMWIHHGFVILRTPLKEGLEGLQYFMNNITETNITVIFKMYNKFYHEKTVDGNIKYILQHPGHTISIARVKNNNITHFILIDPQNKIFQKTTDFFETIKVVYGESVFNFMDIINTVSNNFTSGRPILTNFTYNNVDHNSKNVMIPQIIPLDEKKWFGGLKRKKNKKTKNKINKIKSKKTKKNKKGGKIPSFEELTKEIDKDQGDKTIIAF